jgi:hypothetical protein
MLMINPQHLLTLLQAHLALETDAPFRLIWHWKRLEGEPGSRSANIVCRGSEGSRHDRRRHSDLPRHLGYPSAKPDDSVPQRGGNAFVLRLGPDQMPECESYLRSGVSLGDLTRFAATQSDTEAALAMQQAKQKLMTGIARRSACVHSPELAIRSLHKKRYNCLRI